VGAAVGGRDGVAIIRGIAVAPDRPGDRPFDRALAAREILLAGERQVGRGLALFLLVLTAFVSAATTDSNQVLIRDIATISGVRENPLVGYGIVIGLKGTGDRQQTIFTTQTLANVLQRLGVQIPATSVQVRNVASVIVTAALPAFAKPGTTLDVTVSSVGDAKSIEGGVLLLTSLHGADGQVYAEAQGPITLGGYSAGGGANSKLVNHPTLLKGIVTERVLLSDGETVKSGDRIQVVLTVEAKNNYEYLLFEDLKPAGLEAVQIRSGESLYVQELKSGGGFTGRSRWVYQELRDRKVAMFIDQLPEGFWQLSYEMRAEAPGTFHALPVLGHAMYVPEIRTNGAETRVRVVD